MCASYFGFVEELPEAASRVLLRVGGHLQDELHDYSLVRHLLHQRFFLLDTQNEEITLCPDSSEHAPCVSNNWIFILQILVHRLRKRKETHWLHSAL